MSMAIVYVRTRTYVRTYVRASTSDRQTAHARNPDISKLQHCEASVSEVTDCTAATSHSSRATPKRGGCIGSAVLRLCSLCVSKRENRESDVGASIASLDVTIASLGASVASPGFRSLPCSLVLLLRVRGQKC